MESPQDTQMAEWDGVEEGTWKRRISKDVADLGGGLPLTYPVRAGEDRETGEEEEKDEQMDGCKE